MAGQQPKFPKGMPQRRSIAGPALLSAQASPGAIRKSLAYAGGSSRRSKSTDVDDDDENSIGICPGPASIKDFKSIEGRITIEDITDAGNNLLCCQYNEEYNFITVGCSDGNLMFYQPHTGDFIMSLCDDEIRDESSPITAIKHRPVNKNYPLSNCLTCTYGNGFVKCWNYNFKQCIYTIKEKRDTFGICYHPRFPKFVTFGDDLKIYLYDEESKTQERVLTGSTEPSKHDGPTSRVFAACFNPRNNYELITGGWDDIIHFWDLRQPYSFRQISDVHICGESLDINFKGTEILACSFDNESSFRIFDYTSCKMIGKIANSKATVGKLYSGRFINKDYAVCGGASPNSFAVIDLSTYQIVAKISGLPKALYSLDIGPAKKEDSKAPRADNFASLPSMAFVAGHKLYQIDFY